MFTDFGQKISVEIIPPVLTVQSQEHKSKLLGPDIFRCGGGLPRERVGAKKFGMSLEIQGNQTFWRDIPGFLPGYPGGKFQKHNFVFNSRSLQSKRIWPWQRRHQQAYSTALAFAIAVWANNGIGLMTVPRFANVSALRLYCDEFSGQCLSIAGITVRIAKMTDWTVIASAITIDFSSCTPS